MQPLVGRSKVVIAVFVAIAVVSVVASISTWSLMRFLQEAAAGAGIDKERAARLDGRQWNIGLVQSGLSIVCAVAFLMWFHRAHENLRLGGLRDLEYSPGWAVGGFFVPFLNLVRPFQVMSEVWDGSTQLASKPGRRVVRSGFSPIVAWWWGLFVITTIVGYVSSRMMANAEELAANMRASKVMLFSDFLNAPTALVALLLVKQVTGLQEQARRAGSPHPAGVF